MSNTTKRALIVIDVQNEYFSGNLPIGFPPLAVSLPNITLAMDAAKNAGIPIVVVQHSTPEGTPIMAKGSHGMALHEAVASRHYDHLIVKPSDSAFVKTDLAEWLAKQGIETLTLVGYMTHNCDFSTALQASQLGFAVEVLSDASGSLAYSNQAGTASAEEIHRVISVVLQSNFAAVSSTQHWLETVAGAAALPRDSIYQSNQRARGLI